MLRTVSSIKSDHWTEKTMSVMQEQQLQMCQERLLSMPMDSLFDDIDRDSGKRLFLSSYYAKEMRGKIPTVAQLRKLVTDRLHEEAMFLSNDEEALVRKMLDNDGEIELDTTQAEISAAESLVARLWCTFQYDDELDTAWLSMPENLKLLLKPIMDNPMSFIHRVWLVSIYAGIQSVLYITGFLPTSSLMNELSNASFPAKTKHPDIYLSRFLRASFDYTENDFGEIVLLHAGLADVESIRPWMNTPGDSLSDMMDKQNLLGGLKDMLPQEKCAIEMLAAELCSAVRPEISCESAINDLRLLCKQGASFDELKAVMATLLCVAPSKRLNDALYQLHRQIVRWPGMPSAILN